MNATTRLKTASFLSKDPSMMDYGRVGGRTVLEGAVGGYGGSALAALLAGLLAKKGPPGMQPFLKHLPGIGGGVGAAEGAMHGFQSAKSNLRDRLSPVSRLKQMMGL